MNSTVLFMLIQGVIGITLMIILLQQTKRNESKIMGVTFSKSDAETRRMQRIIIRTRIAIITIIPAQLILSVYCLTFLPKAWIDLLIFPSIVILFASIFLLVYITRNKLTKVKKEEQWNYVSNSEPKVTVDLKASRELGKASPSSIYVWIAYILSFAPIAVSLLYRSAQPLIPLWAGFLGPLMLLIFIPLYRQQQRQHSPVISADSQVNQAVARGKERIRSLTVIRMAYLMLIFWLLLFATMILNLGYWMFFPIALILFGSVYIQSLYRRQIDSLEAHLLGPEIARGRDAAAVEESETGYYRYGFYYSKYDTRVLVPKQSGIGMGWTFNVAQPMGKVLAAGIMVIVVLTLAFVAYISLSDKVYDYRFEGEVFSVKAPMYPYSVDRKDIAKMEVLDKLPAGSRTNGYGGLTQSYGHFYFQGIGDTRFYSYGESQLYILLRPKDPKNPTLIVQQRKAEDTELLRQDLQKWLEGTKP